MNRDPLDTFSETVVLFKYQRSHVRDVDKRCRRASVRLLAQLVTVIAEAGGLSGCAAHHSRDDGYCTAIEAEVEVPLGSGGIIGIRAEPAAFRFEIVGNTDVTAMIVESFFKDPLCKADCASSGYLELLNTTLDVCSALDSSGCRGDHMLAYKDLTRRRLHGVYDLGLAIGARDWTSHVRFPIRVRGARDSCSTSSLSR